VKQAAFLFMAIRNKKAAVKPLFLILFDPLLTSKND
jgi:hypothetical protein